MEAHDVSDLSLLKDEEKESVVPNLVDNLSLGGSQVLNMSVIFSNHRRVLELRQQRESAIRSGCQTPGYQSRVLSEVSSNGE